MANKRGQVALITLAVTVACGWAGYLTKQVIAEGRVNVRQEEEIVGIKDKLDKVNENQCKVLKAVSPKSVCLE